MTRHTHEGETVRPVDIELGDDGDMPGTLAGTHG